MVHVELDAAPLWRGPSACLCLPPPVRPLPPTPGLSRNPSPVTRLGHSIMLEKFEPVMRTASINLPTSFDEASFPQQQAVLPPPKHGKLSKGAGAAQKQPRKTRWSLRGGKAAAVAG